MTSRSGRTYKTCTSPPYQHHHSTLPESLTCTTTQLLNKSVLFSYLTAFHAHSCCPTQTLAKFNLFHPDKSSTAFIVMSSQFIKTEFPDVLNISPWELELAHERSVPPPERHSARSMSAGTKYGNTPSTSQEREFGFLTPNKLAIPKSASTTTRKPPNNPTAPKLKQSKTGRISKLKTTRTQKHKNPHTAQPKEHRTYTLTKVLERFESFYGVMPGSRSLPTQKRFEELVKAIERVRVDKENGFNSQ
jgi:hypothetical protein